MANFEATIKRCVEHLTATATGHDSAAMSAALKLTYAHVSGALCLAAERNLIKWVHAPVGQAHNRRVYYSIEAAPKRNGELSRKKLGKRVATEAQQHAGYTNRERTPPKVTYCPQTMDNRYTVKTPEAFFGAMKLGEYLKTDSAIERAYK